jgi:hypothetical protein
MSRWRSALGAGLVVLAAGSREALAQFPAPGAVDPFLPAPPPVAEQPPLPRLRFVLRGEVALPGPLPGAAPRLVGERIEIDVAGAVASTGWAAGAPLVLRDARAAEPVPPDSPWVEDPRGRYRTRPLPDDRILTQRRCKRCRKGWHRAWKARVPGASQSPPALGEQRVYVGSRDNRVYALRLRNGHRVWTADLGERLSKPLVLWSPRELAVEAQEPEQPLRLLLVVPAAGSRLIALDARSGRVVAEHRLEEAEGELVSAPLTTPDDRVVVARQSYARAEASLLVFQLEPQLDEAPSGEALPYNGSARRSARAPG